MTVQHQRSESGFTLVETLIAFVILSTSLVVMYQIFTDGFRARTRAGILSICAEHAEQVKDRIQIEAKASGDLQSQTGTFDDGYEWAVLLRESRLEREGVSLIGYDVTVLSPTRAGSVTLSSFLSLRANETNR